MSQRCSVCEEAKEHLLKCGRCSSRVYCGPECQKKDWPTHKNDCKRQNYILKVDLKPRFITNPRITRTLSCPANATFEALHEALLVAFGWANTHLYKFEVLNHSDVRGHENRLVWDKPLLKITDLSTEEEDDSSNQDSSKIKLFKILDDPKTKSKTIHYNYDFGDGWQHVISCTGRTAVTPHFVCLEGEGHGCAEDVGGDTGWKELLVAYDAETPTKKQKELMKWFETTASNKDPEGLRGEKKWKWDKDRINVILSEFSPSGSKSTPTSDPAVLIVSLEKQPFFDDMFSDAMARLRSVATVVEVIDIASAMHHMSKAAEGYAAVIISDAAVMEKDFDALQTELVEYARGGGTVIFGFHFSCFAPPIDLNRFFKKRWNVNWTVGSYTRETFTLNPQINADFRSRRLPSLHTELSMKALHLSKTNIKDRVYVCDLVGDDSPAVFSKYGHGYLGWIGDVNGEIGTTDLLLSMCGV